MFDPESQLTKVIKSGTSCSLYGIQTYWGSGQPSVMVHYPVEVKPKPRISMQIRINIPCK